MVSVDIIWISNFIVYVVTKAIVDLSGCWHTMMEKATMRTIVIYRVVVEKQSKNSQLVLYLISHSLYYISYLYQNKNQARKTLIFFRFVSYGCCIAFRVVDLS